MHGTIEGLSQTQQDLAGSRCWLFPCGSTDWHRRAGTYIFWGRFLAWLLRLLPVRPAALSGVTCWRSMARGWRGGGGRDAAGPCFGQGTRCLRSGAPCPRAEGSGGTRSRSRRAAPQAAPHRPSRARRCRGDGAAGGGGGRGRGGRPAASAPRRCTEAAGLESVLPLPPSPAAIPYYRRASGAVDHSDIIPRTPVTSAPGAGRDVGA